MPRVFSPSDEHRKAIKELNEFNEWLATRTREAINREAGAKNPKRRYQPLAQGKPASGRSKGKPPRGRRAPRKGSRAK